MTVFSHKESEAQRAFPQSDSYSRDVVGVFNSATVRTEHVLLCVVIPERLCRGRFEQYPPRRHT